MKRRLRETNGGGGTASLGYATSSDSVATDQNSKYTIRSWGPEWGRSSSPTKDRGRSTSPMNGTSPTTTSRRRRRSVSLPRMNFGNKQKHVTATLKGVNDIEKLAQRAKGTDQDTFRIFPDFAYPNQRMNREDLKVEMNLPSAYYHNLRQRSKTDDEIGLFYLEVLQCFGLPRFDYFKEPSAFVVAVCGSQAFKTDVMPPLVNPMWLSKMRRACTFPVYFAYQTCHIGVFSQSGGATAEDGFSGRIGLKLSQFRPGSTYDVTLPLRLSTQVYARQQRGSIRIRFHLHYHSESAAVWSYIPSRLPKLQPNESVVVNCADTKSFQNVARTVHGLDMQSKFSMGLVKALSREVQFQQIHILRYLPKRELHELRTWKYPIISAFVFCAWMHAVYFGSVRYLPGNIITYILLHMWKNYGIYCLDGKYDNGFIAPTAEELLRALIKGDSDQKRKSRQQKRESMNHNGNGSPFQREAKPILKPKLEPISMERTDPDFCKEALQDLHYNEANDNGDGLGGDEDKPATLEEIAKYFRHMLPTGRRMHWLKVYENTFLGSDAVSFFVLEGYAKDRKDAVRIGRKLAKQFKLFQHIAKKHDFEDDNNLVYRFLTLDKSDYVIVTHKPFAKGLFRALNFRADPSLAREHAHIEFPFASAEDHPRFKVKDSLILRSKESRALLEKMQAENDEKEAINALGVERHHHHHPHPRGKRAGDKNNTKGGKKETTDKKKKDRKLIKNFGGGKIHGRLAPGGAKHKRGYESSDDEDDDNSLTDPASSTYSEIRRGSAVSHVFRAGPLDPTVMVERRDSIESLEALIEKENDPRYEIKIFPKPPNQDLTARSKRGDKTMAEVLVATRHKMHQYCGHVFNDRAYKLDLPKTGIGQDLGNHPSYGLQRNQEEQRKGLFRRGEKGVLNSVHGAVPSEVKNTTEEEEQLYLSARKDEYDRLLHLGRYAHPNPFVTKIAEFVQPMLEMAQIGVFINRTLFNILTWRDPILSFWIVFIGSILAVTLHCFPWRTFLGCMGIYFLGPHNWAIRIAKEMTGRYKEPNYDMLIKKKQIKKEQVVARDEPLFSNLAPDNRIVQPGLLDGSNIRPVAVPVSPLMYNRYYDWPPEPEYTRVTAATLPENNPDTQDYIESLDFDPSDYTVAGGIASSAMVKPLTRWMRARQMGKKAMKDVKKGVKKGVQKVVTNTNDAGRGLYRNASKRDVTFAR